MTRSLAPIRVIIADDHALVREGLTAVLERTTNDILVVGEASGGNQALEVARRTPADIYVLDISMPSLNGLEVMARLLRRDKQAKIIILSMHEDKATIERALRAGARGYLAKISATGDIARALRTVYSGRYYLSPSLSDVIAILLDDTDGYSGSPSAGQLSSKEREIIQMIAEGQGNKQIAYLLKISPHTVHAHRHNIALKLDIHKQTDLVRYAIKEGIVTA